LNRGKLDGKKETLGKVTREEGENKGGREEGREKSKAFPK